MTKSILDNFDLGLLGSDSTQPVDAIRQVATERGVNPDYLIGLAKLETRLGDASIKGGGNDTRNLFNIKDISRAGTGIRGRDTAEGSNDRYRQYASYRESAEDLVGLLDRKYPGALQAESGQQFAMALKRGGYATDPQYVQKLTGVIGGGAGHTQAAAETSNWSSQMTDEGLLAAGGFGGSTIMDRAAPSKKEDRSEFMRGFGRSGAEIPGMAAGVAAYGADVVGATDARDSLLGYAKERQTKVEEEYGSDAASFSNVLDGKASTIDFLKNASGYVVGQALMSLATGGIGAIGAKMLAKQGIVAMGEKLAAEQLAAQLAKGATQEAAQKLAQEAATSFLKSEALRIGLKGATVGAGAQNLGMELGSIYPDAVEQAVKNDGSADDVSLLRVGGAAVGAAALETAMDRFGIGRMLGGSKVGKEPVKFLGSELAARAAKEVPAGMARESATEGMQTGIERFGASKSLTNAEARREYIDSMAVGGVGGGLAGVVSSRKAEEAAVSQITPASPVVDPVTEQLQTQVDKGNSPLSRAALASTKTLDVGQAFQYLNIPDQASALSSPQDDAANPVARDFTTEPGMGFANDPPQGDVQSVLEKPADAGFLTPADSTSSAAPIADNIEANQAVALDPLASAATESIAQEAPIADTEAPDPKTKWLKAIVDQNRTAGTTGVQLKVTEDGKLSFIGDPKATRQGMALEATLQEALKAGATIPEVVARLSQPVANPIAETSSESATPAPLVGEPINQRWTAFHPASGILNMPRAEMPQIKSEHRGAMVNFLKARGITGASDTVAATDLKPTQAEFSPSKVKKAVDYVGSDRPVLVSSDGYVLDGHHQWLGKAQKDAPVAITRLSAPIKDLLVAMREFPSAGMTKEAAKDGRTQVQAPVVEAAPVSPGNPGNQPIRARRAALTQLASQGFSQVESDALGHRLVNPESNTEVVLGSSFDALLAKQAIANYTGQQTTGVQNGQDTGAASDRLGEQLNSSSGKRSVDESALPYERIDANTGRSTPSGAVAYNGPADSGQSGIDGAMSENLQLLNGSIRGIEENRRVLKKRLLRSKSKEEAQHWSIKLSELPELNHPPKPELEAFAALKVIWSKSFGDKPLVAYWDERSSADGATDGFEQYGVSHINLARPYMALQWTIGHEFEHATEKEQTPAQERIRQLIWNEITEDGRRKFFEGFLRNGVGSYAHAMANPSAYNAQLSTLKKEMLAEFMGARFTDVEWLKNLEKQKPNLFGSFIQDWLKTLDNIIASLKSVVGLNQDSAKNVDKYLKDLEKAKAFALELAISWAERNPKLAQSTDAGAVIQNSARTTDEYTEVESRLKGTEQWLKAPNGQATKLTERQWVQTRTPAFKNWFGDFEAFAKLPGGVWNDDKGAVSKAVDANGDPVIVYHGTDNGGFMSFQQPGGERRGDLGIFTTSNEGMAHSYVRKGRANRIADPGLSDVAEWWNDEGGANEEIPFGDLTDKDVAAAAERYWDEVAQYEDKKAGIYAAFVNLRNPNETDFEGALWSGSREHQYIVLIDGETMVRKDGKQYFDNEDEAKAFAREFPNPLYEDDDGSDYVRQALDEHWETTDQAVREGRQNKNDGTIIRQVVDDGGGPGYDMTPSDVFIAFSPNQIKSADFNTGEFGETDDIRYSAKDSDSAKQADYLRSEIERAGGRLDDILQIDQLADSKDIPVITLQDLVGLSIFPTIADRTASAAVYTGIDSSRLNVAIPMLGGPLFPLRESNLQAGVVWANRGNGVTSQKAAKLKTGANYMMVLLGDADMHQSNSTVAAAAMGTLEAWQRDGRLSEAQVEALGDMVRSAPSADKNVKEHLENFPGFDDASIMHAYMDGMSFESRKRVIELLASKEAAKLGAPPMNLILDATREPSMAGHRWGDGVILLEVDQENHQVDLGTKGTTLHPDFPVGIRGKVVGRLNAPISWQALWRDWLNANNGASPRRAFELSKPIVTVTQELIDRIGPISQDHIDSARQARLAADFAADNWRKTGVPVNQGGASPQEFVDAIQTTAARPVLTEYSLDQVKQGAKDGSFKVFQLGADGKIFFGMKYGDPGYAADYGIETPDIGNNEVALVSVVNNEQGARGIAAPAVVLKALQEGATVLDCFAVKSDNFTDGFLPEIYAAFGFEKVAEVPFDPAYYSKQKLADAVKFWQDTTPGYNPATNGYPPLVIMKWKGSNEDRADIINRYLRAGIAGVLNGRASPISEKYADRVLSSSGAEGNPQGQDADAQRNTGHQGNSAGARIASRAQRTIQGIANLNDGELKNLGLTIADRSAVRRALGIKEGSPVQRSGRVDERSVQLSWEAKPGLSTGLLPNMGAELASRAQKAYLSAIREALNEGGQGAQTLLGWGKDRYSESMDGGAWKGLTGWSIQSTLSLPNGKLDARTKHEINFFLAVNGMLMSQEGMAWHLPIFGEKGLGVEFNLNGRKLSDTQFEEVYAAIQQEFRDYSIPPIPSKDGLRFLNYTGLEQGDFTERLKRSIAATSVYKIWSDTYDANNTGRDSAESRKNDGSDSDVRQGSSDLSREPGHNDFDSFSREGIRTFSHDGDLIENDWKQGEGQYRKLIRQSWLKLKHLPGSKLPQSLDALNAYLSKQQAGVDKVNQFLADRINLGKSILTRQERESGIKDSPEYPAKNQAQTARAKGAYFKHPDGSLMTMYHGGGAEIQGLEQRSGISFFASTFPKYANEAARIAGEFGEDGATPVVYPVNVLVNRPLDWRIQGHRDMVAPLMAKYPKGFSKASFDAALKAGKFELIESPEFADAAKKAGFDSLLMRDDKNFTGFMNVGVFDPADVVSAISPIQLSKRIESHEANERAAGSFLIHDGERGYSKDAVRDQSVWDERGYRQYGDVGGGAARDGQTQGGVVKSAREHGSGNDKLPAAGLSIQKAIHFGNRPGLRYLSGSSSGTGIKGAELDRLSTAKDERIKQRVYFYTPVAGGIPQPEIGLGGSVYQADLDGLYDMSLGSVPGSGNQFESAVLDAGYRGFINREQGTIVILGRDVKVDYIGGISDHKVIQRRNERIIPVTRTMNEGNELTRKPNAAEMTSLAHPERRAKVKSAAPSFKLEYGTFRVKRDEAAAADQAISEFSPTFRFGELQMSARENAKQVGPMSNEDRHASLLELLGCV